MKRLVVTWLVVMAVVISGLPATAQEETEAPEGSRLTTAVSDEQAVTEISIADHAAFDPHGGAAAFEPGTTREEFFTYDSVDPETGDLVDIRRGDDELFAHPAESFVWGIPGSASEHAISAELHGASARIAVASVEDFDAGGGNAILEPGTPSQERFSYATVDPDTNELVGITRANPVDHPERIVVQVKEWSEYPPTTTDEHETSPSPFPSPNSSETLDAAIADGDPSTSPLPEPVSAALSDEQGPSDDLTAVTDGFVGAVPTETIPSHEVGLDGFVGASSLPTCKDIFGGSCPIDATNPCDDGAGRTCAQWLQDILSTLGDPDGWCYTAADRRCAELTQYIIGAIGNPDSWCYTAMDRRCAELAQFILDLVGTPDSWCYTATDRPCAHSLQYVLDLIGDPDSWCYRVTDRRCAELAQYLIGLIDAVCNDNNTSTTGVNECVPMAIELVETVADIACNDNYTGTQGSTECINMVVNAIRDVQVLVCGSSDMSACQQNLINQINAAIEALCNDQSTATTGVNECVPMAIELVETVADIACNDNYTGTQGSTECINMVVNAINGVMLIACGSTAQGTCINNLINTVNTTLATACGTVPVAPGGSTPGDVPPGIAQCAVKLLGTVNLIMTTACQSTDGGTCATNLITKIDTTVGSVCGAVSTTDSGSTAGIPPGVGQCVLKLLGTINYGIEQTCGSSDPATCAEFIQRLLETCTTDPSGCVPTIFDVCQVSGSLAVPIPGLCEPAPGPVPCSDNPWTCVGMDEAVVPPGTGEIEIAPPDILLGTEIPSEALVDDYALFTTSIGAQVNPSTLPDTTVSSSTSSATSDALVEPAENGCVYTKPSYRGGQIGEGDDGHFKSLENEFRVFLGLEAHSGYPMGVTYRKANGYASSGMRLGYRSRYADSMAVNISFGRWKGDGSGITSGMGSGEQTADAHLTLVIKDKTADAVLVRDDVFTRHTEGISSKRWLNPESGKGTTTYQVTLHNRHVYDVYLRLTGVSTADVHEFQGGVTSESWMDYSPADLRGPETGVSMNHMFIDPVREDRALNCG